MKLITRRSVMAGSAAVVAGVPAIGGLSASLRVALVGREFDPRHIVGKSDIRVSNGGLP